MSTFTHITNIDLITDTTQISQILYDNIPVAWIEYDSFKRIIVHYKDEWYYIDGNNLTIRTIIYSFIWIITIFTLRHIRKFKVIRFYFLELYNKPSIINQK